MTAPLVPMLQQALREPGLRAYALLDGARAPDLAERLKAPDAPASHPLLGGDPDAALQKVMPRLAVLDGEGELARWMAAGWGGHWGVVVLSPAPLETLRVHFRKLAIVYREDGRPALFRYFDPRVLRVVAPELEPAQLQRLFGPVTAYWIEAASDADAIPPAVPLRPKGPDAPPVGGIELRLAGDSLLQRPLWPMPMHAVETEA